MKKSHNAKSQELGINFSTASAQLRKKILFHLSQKCGMDTWRYNTYKDAGDALNTDYKRFNNSIMRDAFIESFNDALKDAG